MSGECEGEMLFPDGVLTKHEDEEKNGEVLSDMAALLACCPGLLGMLPQQEQDVEETLARRNRRR